MADAAQMQPAGFEGQALFLCLRDAGLFDAINTVLVMNLRKVEGHSKWPSLTRSRKPISNVSNDRSRARTGRSPGHSRMTVKSHDPAFASGDSRPIVLKNSALQ
jgi:hypothetical protein